MNALLMEKSIYVSNRNAVVMEYYWGKEEFCYTGTAAGLTISALARDPGIDNGVLHEI